jgi:hypothetical protein
MSSFCGPFIWSSDMSECSSLIVILSLENIINACQWDNVDNSGRF